jgi:hypothetical protein
VLPAPSTYEVATGNGTTNGPITTSDFDKQIGAGEAQATGFVRGYDITYDASATSESIESILFTFSSPANAAGFEPAVVENSGASGLAPVKSTLDSIRGSTVLTSTKADSDGFYTIDVIAIKGPTVMVVEYANDAPPAGIPTVLSASAMQQFSLI